MHTISFLYQEINHSAIINFYILYLQNAEYVSIYYRFSIL